MAILPTRSEGHVDVPLSNVLIARMAESVGNVNKTMFPAVNVPKPSGRYFEYPPDAWYRTSARARAPGTESPGTNFHINPDNFYQVKVQSVHTMISEMLQDTMDAPIDLLRDGTALVASDLELRSELDWKTAYYRPGIWTGWRKADGSVADWDPSDKDNSGSIGGQWDLATSDPIRDVRFIIDKNRGITGRSLNRACFSQDVWSCLLNHPAIIERVKYTQLGFITEDLVAKAMGLDQIVVSSGIVNSAQEGQVANFGYINSNSFLLTHTPNAPGIMIPSAGYRFAWTGYRNTQGLTATIRQIPDPHRESIKVEGSTAYSFNQTGSDLAVYGTNVLSKA